MDNAILDKIKRSTIKINFYPIIAFLSVPKNRLRLQKKIVQFFSKKQKDESK